MRTCMVMVLLMAGCSVEPARATDAGPGGTRDSGLPVDAGPTANTVTCSKVHTKTEVKADGERIETRLFFEYIDGIDPKGDYRVEMCGQYFTSTPSTPPPPCPSGSTCTESGERPPSPDDLCYWYSHGPFVLDRLYIACGSEAKRFDSNGQLTYTSMQGYAAIRIHR